MSWPAFLPFFHSSFDTYLLNTVPSAGDTAVNPTVMNFDFMMKTDNTQINTFENIMLLLHKCLEGKCYGREKLIGGPVFRWGSRPGEKA